MITSFQNVKVEFYRLFAGEDLKQPLSLTTWKGDTIQVPVKFARKSVIDYTEEKKESYPIIAIQDFLPTPSSSKNNYSEKRISGYRDTDNDGSDDTATYYPEPIWYDMRFEVSIATKKQSEFDAIIDWFAKTFDVSVDAFFLFNKVELRGSEPIGDSVTYRLEYNDSPRTDGIFEASYSFTLNPAIFVKEGYDVEVGGSVQLDLEL